MTPLNQAAVALAHTHYHDHLIEQALPDWLGRATPAQVDVLRQSMQQSLASGRRLSELLSNLMPIQAFCKPLLTEALFSRFGDGLDSQQDIFVATHKEPVITSQPIGVPVTELIEQRMNLFEAALRNFSSDQASAAGLIAGTRMIVARPQTPSTLDFIDCCRSLDLGGAYQIYLKSVLRPTEESGQSNGPAAQRVISMIALSFRQAMYVDAQLAQLKQALSTDDFHIIEQACTLKPVLDRSGTAVEVRRLKLLGVKLDDIVVFDLADGRVIAYLPGDPVRPVQAFGSLRLLANELERRLRNRQYQRFFSRFVPYAGYGKFFATLQQRFGSVSDLAIIGLDERLLSVDGALYDSLARRRIQRILDDAAMLAVPTATLDHQAALEHARRRAAEGLTLLNLAGLFVPGLGEVMLGVAVWQLLGEVYHGVEDWHDGDIDEAMGHLFNVAANVALLGATVVGVTVARGAFVRSAFVDSLEPAEFENGRTRLWKMTLAPWQQALPRFLIADAFGLYTDGPLRWVCMEGHFYPVKKIEASGRWQLLPINGLAPMLTQNGAGAWRAVAEDPLQWDGSHYLFRRLGEAFAHFDDLSIDRMLEVTGIDAARIRQWHVEGLPADASLEDTRIRFAINERLESFLALLNAGQIPARGHDELLDVVLDTLPDVDAPALMAQLQRQRVDLFESAYRQTQASEDAQVLLLRRDFPSLTLAAAHEILATANANEFLSMRANARIPLRLAEFARGHVRETRITRALEGRYLQSAQSAELEGVVATMSRDQVATFLQMPATGHTFRGLIRTPSGRLGYPLSGRGQGRPRSLTSQVREIYPSMSEDEVDLWISQTLTEGDLCARLDTLRQHSRLLSEALQSWINEVPGPQRRLERTQRERVARYVENCWHRRSTRVFDGAGNVVGYRLVIAHYNLSSWPSLPMAIDFSHVHELCLTSVGLTDMPDSFFRSFTQLRQLELPNNRLQRLPTHLARCSQLTTLNLNDNFIHLNEVQSATLGRLSALTTLSLSGNPIGPALDLTSLNQLTSLYLRRTQIDALPRGLLDCRTLDVVDLRDNQITTLPEAFYRAPRWVTRNIALRGNPLQEQVALRWSNHMEVLFRIAAVAEDAAARSNARLSWLAGSAQALRAERTVNWDLLEAEEGSSAFFSVLVDLQDTADFADHRADLNRRVFDLLEAMSSNARLRREIFDYAMAPLTCHDSVALVFSSLEMRRWVWWANEQAAQGAQGPALLRLARRLFRLDEVERIAAEDVQARRESGANPDEIEVSLAYRTGLRDSLELPGQPMGMLYGGTSGVTGPRLSAARRRVLAAERSEQLAASISQRDFWVDFLRVHHGAAFEAMDAPFHAQADALINRQASLQDADYLEQMEAIAHGRQVARDALILRLTRESLATNPEVGH